MKSSDKTRNWAKILIVIILFSLVAAFPTTLITFSKSTEITMYLYNIISLSVQHKSPGEAIFDEYGVPSVNYGYKDTIYIGIQKNPLYVANAAIIHYNSYKKDNNLLEKNYFKNCIEWLNNSKKISGKCYLWEYNYINPPYISYNSSWYSGLAQGKIMLAFLLAFEDSGDNKYFELANKTMISFDTLIDDGGVMYRDSNSTGKWYEEVATTSRATPTFILNGHLEVLEDLYDFYLRTNSLYAKQLFDDGLIEVKQHLKDYDTGYWTYYDREKNFAYDYHYVHVYQLRHLYELTGDSVISEYYKKWDSYLPLNPLWARKRFAAYILNVAIILTMLTSLVILNKIIKRKRSIMGGS